MKNIHRFANAIYRKRNSMFFRFLCVVYATIIIATQKEQYFSMWVYITAIIGYIIMYLLMMFKRDKLRLLCDYLFIAFIAYKKPIDDINIIVFILLPIFNAINFSGRKRSPYLLLAFSFFIFSFLSISLGKNDIISIMIAFSALFCIDYYSSLRWKLAMLSQQLLDRIDDFYATRTKPHFIYENVIQDINDFLKDEYVENIFCLIKEQNKRYKIVNSSIFVFEFAISIEKDKEKEKALANDEIISNIYFTYGNTTSTNNIVYPIKSTQNDDTCQYIFIMTLTKKLSFYWFLSGFVYLINPFFTRVAKVLHNEKKLNDIRRETLKDIGNKARFVEQAVNTMHFIRNRLTPYKTLLELLEERKTVQQEIRSSVDKMIESQRKVAKQELTQIIDKANYLLEKDNNPFNYKEYHYISLRKFFSQIRSIWFESFEEQNFYIENFNSNDLEKYKIYSNFEGLDILLSDWITNMSKYKNNLASCKISIESAFLKLIFKNDYISTEQNIRELVDDLNSDDRQQITRRTTHGIFIMKQIIQELNINHKAYKGEKENSNILILEIVISLQEDNIPNE